MTDTYELPPLPGANVELRDANGRALSIRAISVDNSMVPVYTADQMKEYARLAVKAERERATRALDLSDDQIDMILDAAKVPEPPSGWREDYDVQVVRAIIAHLRAELYCG